MPLPAAVLWDLDGTLVDTEPSWISAETALVEEYDDTWSHEQGLQLVGLDLLDAAALIREQTAVPLSPGAIVERLLDAVVARVRDTVPWRPGARELLAELNERGVPCALVTMSWTRLVEPILAALPADSFGAVVTGDRVSRGKPHPEPYLTAARLLGVEAAACLAIEDSETGCRSAEAAGCLVLAVPAHVALRRGERRVLRTSLAGLRTDALPAVAAS